MKEKTTILEMKTNILGYLSFNLSSHFDVLFELARVVDTNSLSKFIYTV